MLFKQAPHDKKLGNDALANARVLSLTSQYTMIHIKNCKSENSNEGYVGKLMWSITRSGDICSGNSKKEEHKSSHQKVIIIFI